ncbi:MAG: MarR family transcriptional regulator [Candidatus Nomurabacteria bacterium]|nr:MarR family transcriptional regulator [Candidatus Nomurabacteria bacterium]
MSEEVSYSTFLLVNILAEHYANHRAPITVTELADKMGLTPAAISQALNFLEQHRIAQRKKSSEDKRQTFVELTFKGKILTKRVNKMRNGERTLGDILEYLGEKDTAELTRIFGRIDEYIEERFSRKNQND